MKFTIVVVLFQLLLIIGFAAFVNYGQHALPPHQRKGGNPNISGPNLALPVNDITIFYPSKLPLFKVL